MVVIIFITTLLLICSFFSKAVKDTLDHHYYRSIFYELNDSYFHPEFSWKNKYKNWPEDKRPKFWGSTTIFVWLTDCWHLVDMIERTCWQLNVTFWIGLYFNLTWHFIIGVFVTIKIICACAFHFPYTYWFIKK